MSKGVMVNGKPVRERIRLYFRDNPTELLTVDDMAVKFEVTAGAVKNALTRLRAAGVVDRVEGYMAGAAAFARQPKEGANP